MKNWIVIVGLVLSLQVNAQEVEMKWKAKLRGLIIQVAGEEWGKRLLGAPPKSEEGTVVTMPEIPPYVKKATNVESYKKIEKDSTEYDRLPLEKKRQFNYKFVQELFLVTRKTEAKDEDLSNWINTLDQGGSREGIYQALVLDDVYAALESLEEKPSKKLTDFVLKFGEKYFNQTSKREALERVNNYSLKRILTEKGLDLMEIYESKNLDALYRWYANFSAELATEYPELLNSEVRSDKSKNYHYEWAKSMPIQHIKSEFIIKIHSVMNGLQIIQE